MPRQTVFFGFECNLLGLLLVCGLAEPLAYWLERGHAYFSRLVIIVRRGTPPETLLRLRDTSRGLCTDS